MKIVKKDYPFTVIIEDKVGKNSGKPYTDIAIGYTEKNINATCDADKYKTTWMHTLDEKDLLKGASIFENAYNAIRETRAKEREQKKAETPAPVSDNIPF